MNALAHRMVSYICMYIDIELIAPGPSCLSVSSTYDIIYTDNHITSSENKAGWCELWCGLTTPYFTQEYFVLRIILDCCVYYCLCNGPCSHKSRKPAAKICADSRQDCSCYQRRSEKDTGTAVAGVSRAR